MLDHWKQHEEDSFEALRDLQRQLDEDEETTSSRDYFGAFFNVSAQACVEGCRDFPTFELALRACNANPDCRAVTLADKYFGGANSIGATDGTFGFQLRAFDYFTESILPEQTYFKGPVSPASGTLPHSCVLCCVYRAPDTHFTLDIAKAHR